MLNDINAVISTASYITFRSQDVTCSWGFYLHCPPSIIGPDGMWLICANFRPERFMPVSCSSRCPLSSSSPWQILLMYLAPCVCLSICMCMLSGDFGRSLHWLLHSTMRWGRWEWRQCHCAWRLSAQIPCILHRNLCLGRDFVSLHQRFLTSRVDSFLCSSCRHSSYLLTINYVPQLFYGCNACLLWKWCFPWVHWHHSVQSEQLCCGYDASSERCCQKLASAGVPCGVRCSWEYWYEQLMIKFLSYEGHVPSQNSIKPDMRIYDGYPAWKIFFWDLSYVEDVS